MKQSLSFKYYCTVIAELIGKAHLEKSYLLAVLVNFW